MVDKEDIRLIKKLKVQVAQRYLNFLKPAKTSRDTLLQRKVWYVCLTNEEGITGIGECAPIFGLSQESPAQIESYLMQLKAAASDAQLIEMTSKSSAIAMALQTALYDVLNGGTRKIFATNSPCVIPINGLVWMNEKETMLEEAIQKIKAGFNCIKLKIGGIQFSDELDILREIRSQFSKEKIELRLDANGAFSSHDALQKLKQLAAFDIHSIEQPVKAGQWNVMASVIKNSPIPVALDEELIGVHEQHIKQQMLEELQPHYIILKPSLHGAFAGCNEWIAMAEQNKIGWWVTSALESNIGLNAIAQWVCGKQSIMHQGLGTGSLYENNIDSPITIDAGYLKYDTSKTWDVREITNLLTLK
jgi:o-succinylbenzoate synthase